MTQRWVLMYHRVCPRDRETACWFSRGTAVTPEAFEAQIGWLQERFDVGSLAELAEPDTGASRPRIAITFDDGYTDVIRSALPVLRRRGLTGTCFASAAPATHGSALWFDTWYTSVPSGMSRPSFLGYLRAQGVPVPTDLEGFVTGPPKQWLAGLHPSARNEHLRALSDLAGTALSQSLYLDLDGLQKLCSLGWEIGGHGLHHVPLAECDAPTRDSEIAASTALLDRVGVRGPRVFAYPNGSHDQDAADAVQSAGFSLACTVQRGPWTPETLPMRIPRLFCRGDTPVPHRLLSGA